MEVLTDKQHEPNQWNVSRLGTTFHPHLDQQSISTGIKSTIKSATLIHHYCNFLSV